MRLSGRGIATETAKATDAAKDKILETSTVVKEGVADAGTAGQEAFNTLITEVKRLIAEGKGAEALQTAQSARVNLKLTAEQQKILDDLTKPVLDALAKSSADSATKAVGTPPKPKP